jgi:hypothetical protein
MLMLLWVVLVFFITLLFSIYREGFTPMQDELGIPNQIFEIKLQDFQALLDAKVFWKELNMQILQDMMVVLDNRKFIDTLKGNNAYLRKLTDEETIQRGNEFLQFFQLSFYDDYRKLIEIYSQIDRITGTEYKVSNPTMKQRNDYYLNFDTSKPETETIKSAIEQLKTKVQLIYKKTAASYGRVSTFYRSGFEIKNNMIVAKKRNLSLISQGYDNSNFIKNYKEIIMNKIEELLIQEKIDKSNRDLELAKKKALEIKPSASISFFSTIMDKLNLLEKKELVPIFTNKPVEVLAVDRYMEPSCKDGESIFCSGKISCTDIFGNEIPDMMKSEENASYTSGKTYSNCGSYTNRIEYKEWVSSLSKDLLGPATEIVVYDTSNCTITNPWKLVGSNTSCYLSVEKAQNAFLEKNTVKNELLLGRTVLLDSIFLEDHFRKNPESIFKLNHPTENIDIQRFKYKGNMQINEPNQDIDALKALPKVSVNQKTYYKGKITQINKDGYDLIIPEDYGIKVAGIKKENLFMPNISYLNVLNETLTDATVNSLPRPMCSGSFSKCSNTPKFDYDPSDTMKKNLINKYEKVSPYLLTSAEISDNCPSTSSTIISTSSLGFSVF